MKSIQLKINKQLPPYMEGQTVTVQVDEFGTPIRKYWRDRLHDAETDECVEIVQEKKTKTKTQTKPESPKEDS